MTTRSVIAVDAGQSGIKVRVLTVERNDDLLFRGIDTHEPLLPQLAEVVRASISQTKAAPGILTAGISGLTARDADAGALLALTRPNGIEEVALAHDSTTSYLGALGDQHGAVVASGTGVVTLAAGPREIARVDGWGNIMGDAGSGYWIGREALDAVMRAYDGRGPATGLTDVVRATWPDLSQAYMTLQANEERVRIVAAFTTQVARLASEGDAVSLRITARAAEELSTSVTCAIRRVREDDEVFTVCAIGGVFRSAPLQEAFRTALTRAEPDSVKLIAPLGAGIDGAVALAGLAAEHPFAAHLHRAGSA
ncbi:N-acetylglucosamine kinase [Microbacterium sp. A84]|uniref:N-acetylglucosamine kinase n=1 Tax=Microbacterium sp. A84 TaxID=3450715 RepID=UPI003F445086